MKRPVLFIAAVSILVLLIGFIPAERMRMDAAKAQDIVDRSQEQNAFSPVEPLPAAPGNENLFETFRQGGVLMWPILFLGIMGLAIIIERMIFYYRNRIWNTAFIEARLDAVVQNSDARYREELEDEAQGEMRNLFNSAEKGIALLNGIGNLAPVIGFFGTVQGMIGAFAAIAAATTVNAKVVAVGIKIALITTAGGLSVAVPALAFYYFFAHIIQVMYFRTDELIGRKTRHLPRMSGQDESE